MNTLHRRENIQELDKIHESLQTKLQDSEGMYAYMQCIYYVRVQVHAKHLSVHQVGVEVPFLEKDRPALPS